MDIRERELRDLVISAVILALAFGIAFEGGLYGLSTPAALADSFLLALVGVSLGFILHELGHRFVARRFGCFAEYTMWPAGLALAVGLSLFGFVFAAPGAVMIYSRAGGGMLSRRKLGLISIAGPVMNVALAIVFLVLHAQSPLYVFYLGAMINTWLAAFNLIPIMMLDGLKIFRWDGRIWGCAVAVVLALFVYIYTVV